MIKYVDCNLDNLKPTLKQILHDDSYHSLCKNINDLELAEVLINNEVNTFKGEATYNNQIVELHSCDVEFPHYMTKDKCVHLVKFNWFEIWDENTGNITVINLHIV